MPPRCCFVILLLLISIAIVVAQPDHKRPRDLPRDPRDVFDRSAELRPAPPAVLNRVLKARLPKLQDCFLAFERLSDSVSDGGLINERGLERLASAQQPLPRGVYTQRCCKDFIDNHLAGALRREGGFAVPRGVLGLLREHGCADD